MIADVASPPIEACTKAADLVASTHGATFLVVSGTPSQVRDFLAEASKHKPWVIANQMDNQNNRIAVLRGPLQMPYREIGGLIFEAQRKRLAVTLTSYPPICEFEGK